MIAAKDKRWFEKYDDEFGYSDELEPNIGKIMKEVEEGPRHTHTGSQTMDEYHRLHESNIESKKQYRWEHQEEFKTRREGRILHMNEFIRLLREAGLNAWYTDKGGMAKTLGLYISHAGTRNSCKHIIGGSHYVCFVQVPLMQEFEEMFFDDHDVPLGVKRRGWRTVLLRLIETGFLTESKAHEVFGEPASGPVSRRYRHYLQYLRSKPQ